MTILKTVNAGLEHALAVLFSLLFGLMIADVLLQVVSRNSGVAVLWTLDLAQLLFSWCIFIGAAVGVRRGSHYVITLLPEGMRRANSALKLVSDAVIVTVALVMVAQGFAFSAMGSSTDVESLGISQYWYFLPIPLSGILILVFILEIAIADLAAFAKAFREEAS
ncbi:TRAP transporter small permease [Propylenella binzhouense]|uniref:TRAP transporter small permease protein n=1 Tax=Propylenella binzhouense TaxID=2555902 RepID=A0A964WTS4_9HYPH|nr:TRAP transporter small permease subunit [Propylenella binzhouense]MYZ48304.1 TRAP transporter small permease subunit [Propylenella binzhouense]